MSSIDKDVINHVRVSSPDIVISNEGGYIVGQIRGQEVFRLRDRIGYLNDRERAVIDEGIRQYKALCARRNEEYRKQLEEARRKAEELRKAKYESTKANVDKELASLTEQKRNFDVYYQNKKNVLENKINSIQHKANKVSNFLNYEVSSTRFNKLLDNMKKEYEKKLSEFDKQISKLNQIKLNTASTLSIEDYEKIDRKLKTISLINYNGIFEKHLNDVVFTTEENMLANLNNLNNKIEKFKSKNNINSDKAKAVVNELIRDISNIKINSIEKMKEIEDLLIEKQRDINRALLNEQNDKVLQELNNLMLDIRECQDLCEFNINDTYEVVSFDDEALNLSNEIFDNIKEIYESEFSHCSNYRLNVIKEQVASLLEKGVFTNDILLELKGLDGELKSYIEQDKVSINDYKDYLNKLSELKTLKVPEEEIRPFDVFNYESQKEELKHQIRQRIKEINVDNFNNTDLAIRLTMREMGYEIFAISKNSDGTMAEHLYTKKGYDGVLWQVVILSDGSFTRRLIGVNKGETQTSKDFVKTVSKELDESGEVAKFLKGVETFTNNKCSVASSVEHDSPNVDQVIENNGYQYLSGDALKLYEELTVVDKVEAQKTSSNTYNMGYYKVSEQVNSNNKVRDSKEGLREIARRHR